MPSPLRSPGALMKLRRNRLSAAAVETISRSTGAGRAIVRLEAVRLKSVAVSNLPLALRSSPASNTPLLFRSSFKCPPR